MASSAAFAALRDALDVRFRTAAPGTFVQAEGTALSTGLDAVDRALAGGFPKGAISTLEGPASSGRSALAARVLAVATRNGGVGAIVESRSDPDGFFFPPSLQAAGVALERLLIVRVDGALGVVRAADILLRSSALRAIVIPAVAYRAAAWSRLASLAHRAGAVLLAIGSQAPDEVRYFASLRAQCALGRIDWVGAPGPFRALAGYEICANVCKHKRAIPGGAAHVAAR
jgi:hypothetical protein